MKKIFNTKIWLPLTVIILILVNWLASRWHSRIDLTDEKRFTLSKPVKKVLQHLDDEVTVKVFLKGASNSGFTKLSKSTEELLQEFKEIAGPKLTYKFIQPDETVEGTNVTYADTLAAMGLNPINLTSQVKEGQQQQLVYPVALVSYHNNTTPVNIYEGSKAIVSFNELNSAEAMLEYKFANAIEKLSRSEKPMIAYSIGNGEPTGDIVYDLVPNTLQADYNLKTMNLNKVAGIPDTFKLLMIVKPLVAFNDDEKLKIDQFVMRGGKVIWFVDKLNAEMDSLKSVTGEVVAYDRGLEINDLLFKYGTRINADLVMDLQCDFLPFSVNGKEQFEFLHWNYFPLFETKNNHIINKNIGLVAGRFVNSLDTVGGEGISKTILLSSSPNSRSISTPALISGKENVNAPEDNKFKRANIPVAVLLEGKFKSLYSNRASEATRDTLEKYGMPFQDECLVDNKMIVVADGDIVLNSVVKGQPVPMGMNPYTVGSQYEYQFANKNFLINCLDYLINPSGLSEAKAKDYTLQLLDPKKINKEKTKWQVINIALPVLIVCLFAVIYQWWRRRKYSTK
ncbi:MAG: gliding motility-associated ABC transporter substrate-binding protein GldG [Ferruginibacter sp.]